MSLLFDLEALTTEGGVDAIQIMQRDFNQHLIQFTSSKAMRPVTDYLKELARSSTSITDLSGLGEILDEADAQSKEVLDNILESKCVRKSTIETHFSEAVCLTECTLPGVLAHSARYGRYGLVFEKASLYGKGARPVAHVQKELRLALIDSQDEIPTVKKNMLYFVNLNPPVGQSNHKIQDYTHEREWRCPEDIPVEDAVALIVAKREDCECFTEVAGGRPILPLDLLYRMGL